MIEWALIASPVCSIDPWTRRLPCHETRNFAFVLLAISLCLVTLLQEARVLGQQDELRIDRKHMRA